MKIRLRARARRDLDSIIDYTNAEHGAVAAEAYFALVRTALDRLSEYPELGMARPDISPPMRSFPTGEHRIYYLLLSDRISVVRILHKAMDQGRYV